MIRIIFSLPQSDPGPGSYSPQGLTKPEASLRPPFGSTAERFDRQARRFFLGSTVGFAFTRCVKIMKSLLKKVRLGRTESLQSKS